MCYVSSLIYIFYIFILLGWSWCHWVLSGLQHANIWYLFCAPRGVRSNRTRNISYYALTTDLFLSRMINPSFCMVTDERCIITSVDVRSFIVIVAAFYLTRTLFRQYREVSKAILTPLMLAVYRCIKC